MIASIHGHMHKTLSNLLVAVRSMGVTVKVYVNEVLPEAITVTSTMPSDSFTMYMSCSNCTVMAAQKVGVGVLTRPTALFVHIQHITEHLQAWTGAGVHCDIHKHTFDP